ncbi:hypothetical protein COF51_28365 [Bacillus pseudomycoides]|nr:hypothetical protein COF51_28365 [Bacillus pseudomycoides]
MTQSQRRLKNRFKRYQFHVWSAVSKIAKTLIVREKALLDTIFPPLSSGIMEGTNNKIKIIKRRGFGYKNENHFFLRLRLEIGRFITPDFG